MTARLATPRRFYFGYNKSQAEARAEAHEKKPRLDDDLRTAHSIIVPSSCCKRCLSLPPAAIQPMPISAQHDAYFDALDQIIQPIRAAAYPRPLDRLRALLDALGSPQARFASTVVAGSVGKTTVCHALAEEKAGHGRIGLYTSPHLHSFRERFAIDGAIISMADFTAVWARVRRAAARLGAADFSTFEWATVLAFAYFAEMGVDHAVLEIGLGGRFDAVNLAPHSAAYITPIELEHAAMLGGTLEQIAWHKAGVIRPSETVFVAPQPAEVMAVIAAEAEMQGAALQPWRDLPAVSVPGRLERAPNGVLIDGAHTLNGLRRLLTHLPDRARIAVGMLRDKPTAALLAALDRAGFHLILTTAPGSRGLPAADLAAHPFRAASVEVMPSLDAALDARPDAVVGSLRMAAAARERYVMVSAEMIAEAARTRALIDAKNAAL
jgi:folylpolyglutamate synthase/dihydropteroate synthase